MLVVVVVVVACHAAAQQRHSHLCWLSRSRHSQHRSSSSGSSLQMMLQAALYSHCADSRTWVLVARALPLQTAAAGVLIFWMLEQQQLLLAQQWDLLLPLLLQQGPPPAAAASANCASRLTRPRRPSCCLNWRSGFTCRLLPHGQTAAAAAVEVVPLLLMLMLRRYSSLSRCVNCQLKQMRCVRLVKPTPPVRSRVLLQRCCRRRAPLCLPQEVAVAVVVVVAMTPPLE